MPDLDAPRRRFRFNRHDSRSLVRCSIWNEGNPLVAHREGRGKGGGKLPGCKTIRIGRDNELMFDKLIVDNNCSNEK